MLNFANGVLIFPKMFLFVLFWLGFFFKGEGLPYIPSFILSGTDARKVALIKLTRQVNSFPFFFSCIFFFTQDVLSMVNIYHDLPKIM